MKKYTFLVFGLFFISSSCHFDKNKKDASAYPTLEAKSYPNDTIYYSIEEALNSGNIESVLYLTLVEKGYDTFPDSIFLFKNLKYLDVSMNAFKTIPDKIKELKNLTSLGAAHGKINKISNHIQFLTHLESISFLYNDLEVIPEGICQLRSLQSINFSNNPIQKIPSCIVDLENVNSLSLPVATKVKHKETFLLLEKKFMAFPAEENVNFIKKLNN